MPTHNPVNADSNTCPKCGENKPRYRGRVCRECDRLRAREWRKANPEKVREYKRKCVAAKPEQYRKTHREYQREHQKKNRASRREYDRDYRRNQRANNPAVRIINNVRGCVRDAIVRGGGEKAHRTSHYLGYPLAALVAWVEKQGGIPPGYDLDHRVPFAEMRRRYPGDIVRQQREAWKLCNLQIIPASENRRKGARREFLV